MLQTDLKSLAGHETHVVVIGKIQREDGAF